MNALEVLSSPWAIVPAKLAEIREIYLAHLRGPKVDWKGMEARILAGIGQRSGEDEPLYANMNGVAVIDVCGVMTKGKSLFSYLFSGCNTRRKAEAFRAAKDDPSITSIMAWFDSPGGTVDGTQELAEVIYACRGEKPIVAFCDGMLASAAYWAASACDKRYISGDTVEVGSIGTVYTHVDQSAWDEQMGDKYTEIVAGKYKRIASMHKPLSKEGRDYLQEMVDYLNAVFINDVARNLAVTEDRAIEMADEARIYIGRQAVDAGLVDGVETFDSLIVKLTAGDAARKVFYQSDREEIMDVNELKDKFPAIYQAVFDLGKAEGQAAGEEAGRADGVRAGADGERARIADVRAQLIPGHEALIDELAMDGKTTGPEAAVKILAAEKSAREIAQKKLDEDAKAAAGVKAGDYVPAAGDGEVKTRQDAGDKLDAEAKKLKAEKGCSYADAFTLAKSAHPKWAAVYDGKEG